MSNNNNSPCVQINVSQPCSPCETPNVCIDITPCEGCLPPDYDNEGCIVRTPFSCLKWTCPEIPSVGIETGDDGCVVINKLLQAVVPSALTFNNGLTKTGGLVEFGGTLTKDTTLNLSTFTLNLQGNNVKFGSFQNTRDDSGVTTPLNFLYTDNTGVLKSAELDYILDQVAPPTTPGVPDKSIQFNNNNTFDGDANFIYDYTKSSMIVKSSTLSGNTESVVDVQLNDTVKEPFGLSVVNTSTYATRTAGEFYGIGLKAYNESSATGTPGFIDLLGLRRNAANNANEWTSLVRWGRTGFGSDVANDERVWSFKGRTIFSFNGIQGTTNLPVITYSAALNNATTGDAIALEVTGRSATQSEVVVGPLYDGQTNTHISRLVLRTANIAASYSEIVFRKGLSHEMGRWTNAGTLIVGTNPLSIGNPSTEVSTAALQVESKTKGFLPPRMTQAERLAIAVNAQSYGLMVYQTDGVEGPYVYTSSGWRGFTLI